MSDTPRTDAVLESTWGSINVPTNPIPADFAKQLERELAEAKQKEVTLINTIENDRYVGRQEGLQIERELAEVQEKLAKVINDYETAVLREHRMQEQRDIVIEAIKEIMVNEEGLHRMGYNPYLISYGAIKKIKSYNETKC